jgi:hypothetical protein
VMEIGQSAGINDGSPRLQPAGELGTRPDVELAVDLRQVPLDGLRADEQLGSDLAVGASGGDQLGNLELSRRQPGDGRAAPHPSQLGGGLLRPQPRAETGERVVGRDERVASAAPPSVESDVATTATAHRSPARNRRPIGLGRTIPTSGSRWRPPCSGRAEFWAVVMRPRPAHRELVATPTAGFNDSENCWWHRFQDGPADGRRSRLNRRRLPTARTPGSLTGNAYARSVCASTLW